MIVTAMTGPAICTPETEAPFESVTFPETFATGRSKSSVVEPSKATL